MGSVSSDLYELVEETLGCSLLGMQLRNGDHIIADFGKQDGCVHFLEIPGNSIQANLYLEKEIAPNEKELAHIKKIFNIYSNSQINTASRFFCGAEILETITDRKTIDAVMQQLVNLLVTRGGFCKAGIMFLNEALLELRGVIFADSKNDTANDFRNVKLNFETKNDLSDIMFYDRTDIVSASSSDVMQSLGDYFCNDVMVTGLGVGDRPIGILLACKDTYDEGDKDALLMYGNICSLSIEFSKTLKQLELTMADLGSLRKNANDAENLVKMGRLSATVAHELKNPLVAIGGFTKRMEQTAVNPQTKNYIKIVQSEVYRLERIVGDILIYSRKIDLDLKEFRLMDLISDVMVITQGCLCFSMINVETKVSPDMVVSADYDKLKQVVINIVSNAIQEMPDGGQLIIEAVESDKHITVSVTDTGGGIPSDKREKIFEPFYTLKKTGTGLGLPLCKKIMSAHGGDIVVGDADGGAVFTLIIPKRVR